MPKGVGEIFCHQRKKNDTFEVKCLESEISLLLNDFNQKVQINGGNESIWELE